MPTLAERNRANREKRKEAERKEASQKKQKTSAATAGTESSGNGNHDDLPEILDHIDVSNLGHDEWMKCGTALKASGIPFEVFDDWSSRDTREGEYQGTEFTRRQWESFDANCGLTSGYIVTMAESYGWSNPRRGNNVSGGEEMELGGTISSATDTYTPPTDENNGNNDGEGGNNDGENVIEGNASIVKRPSDGLYALVNEKGTRIAAPVYHIVKSINNHPMLKKVAYDEFKRTIYTLGPLPWDRSACVREWTPIDDKRLYSLLEGRINAKSRDNVRDGLAIAADNNKFDSLKNMMLHGLPLWDGTLRVERMLQDLLGVEDSEYVRKTWRVFMNGAFMRAVQPGCKMELMPVIESQQGGEKTQFCTILAIRDDWYLDGPSDLQDQAKSGRAMYGKFICEQGELRSFKNADWESIKSFLSRPDDKFVDKWEKTPSSIPRRSVLIGTTNRKDFLRDCTGARRFLPYHAGVHRQLFDLYGDEARQYVLQAFAEIAQAYKRGERLLTYLTPDLESLAEPYRAQYSAVDDTASAIIGWVESLDGWDKPTQRICALAVAHEALKISTEDFHKNVQIKNKIAETLDHRCDGWTRNPKRQRCVVRGNDYGIQTVWERRQ